MKRRQFLKSGVAAGALACTATLEQQAFAAQKRGMGNREIYELSCYHLKEGEDHNLLDLYLQRAIIPGMNKRGSKPVGVFEEMEPKSGPAVWVLIPYASIDAYSASFKLYEDRQYREVAREYLNASKDHPAYARIDSWLHMAFAGMPKLELPRLSREGKKRIFEMRTYESHSELKALKKIQMFNSGEIEVMHEVKLSPVFYGQALVGRDLPHLTYMLCGEDREAHKEHFSAFGKHPVWEKLKNDPEYADTVSKITSRFLAPLPYSQI